MALVPPDKQVTVGPKYHYSEVPEPIVGPKYKYEEPVTVGPKFHYQEPPPVAPVGGMGLGDLVKTVQDNIVALNPPTAVPPTDHEAVLSQAFAKEKALITGKNDLNSPTPDPIQYGSFEDMVNQVGDSIKALNPTMPDTSIAQLLNTKFINPPPPQKVSTLQDFPIKPIADMATLISEKVTKEQGLIGKSLAGLGAPFDAFSKLLGGALNGQSGRPLDERSTLFQVISGTAKELQSNWGQDWYDAQVKGGKASSNISYLMHLPFVEQTLKEKVAAETEQATPGFLSPTAGETTQAIAETTPQAPTVRQAVSSVVRTATAGIAGFAAEMTSLGAAGDMLKLTEMGLKDTGEYLNGLKLVQHITEKSAEKMGPVKFVSMKNLSDIVSQGASAEESARTLRGLIVGQENVAKYRFTATVPILKDMVASKTPEEGINAFAYLNLQRGESLVPGHIDNVLANIEKIRAVDPQGAAAYERMAPIVKADRGIPKGVGEVIKVSTPAESTVLGESAYNGMKAKLLKDRTITGDMLFNEQDLLDLQDRLAVTASEDTVSATGIQKASLQEILGETDTGAQTKAGGGFSIEKGSPYRSSELIPSTKEGVLKQYLSEKIIQKLMETVGTTPEELAATVKRISATTGNVSQRVQMENLRNFIESYLPGGSADSLARELLPMVEGGSAKVLGEYGLTPKFNDQQLLSLFENYDKSTGTRQDLARILTGIFDKQTASVVRDVGIAEGLAMRYGFPTLDSLKAWLDTATAAMEKSGVIAPAVEGVVRRSKYGYMSDAMHTVLNKSFEEGVNVGMFSPTQKIDNYFFNLFVNPETDAFDITDVANPMKPAKYASAADAAIAGIKPATHDPFAIYQTYGNRFAAAFRNASLRKSVTEEGGMWFTKAEAPEGWESFKGQGAQYTQNFTNPDGTVVSKSLYAPAAWVDALKVLSQASVTSGTGMMAKFVRNTRYLQSLAKYIDLSVSIFHAKALSLVGLSAMGPVQMYKALRMEAASPEFHDIIIDLVAHEGTVSGMDTTYGVMRALRYGEQAAPDYVNIKELQDLKLFKATKDFMQSNPLTKPIADAAAKSWEGYNKIANLATGVTFDVLQTRYKAMSYSTFYANWLARKIKSGVDPTPLEIDSAKTSIARLVNGLFGGLNFEAMGWSKNVMTGLRSAILAPDWTLSNFIPFGRAFRQLRNLASRTDTVAGDAEALRFMATSIIGGVAATQMTNLALNGKLSSDPWTVELGTDGTGKIIRANMFFAGDTRDIIHAFELFSEEGIKGFGTFAMGKAAPGTKEAIGMFITGKNALGQDILSGQENNLPEKLLSEGKFLLSNAPLPIGLKDLFNRKSTYYSPGKGTGSESGFAEMALGGLGLAYLTHVHTSAEAERNLYALEDRAKYGAENMTPQDFAADKLYQKNLKQIGGLNNARAIISNNTKLSRPEKIRQILALDALMTNLADTILNPTPEQIQMFQPLQQAAILKKQTLQGRVPVTPTP